MVIINGKIYTMEGEIFDLGYVRINRKYIEDVGNMKDFRPQAKQEEILDVAGAWVLPGLIEAHCHVGISEERIGIIGDDCNEGTMPVTPVLRAIDAVNPMDAAFHDAIEAGITSIMVGPVHSRL